MLTPIYLKSSRASQGLPVLQPRADPAPQPHPTTSSCSHIPQPQGVGGSHTLGGPLAPTCLQLARRPRWWLTLEVRASTVGAPNPMRPGSDRHSGRSTGAVASPTQACMHSAGRVGDMRLRRAFRSLAWINQTQSMLGPPWGREHQWGSGSRRRRWQMERGGIGKSDPNAIVAEGNEASAGLGDWLLQGRWGRGQGNAGKTLGPKAKMCPADPRRAPTPCVWENQQHPHLQQPNPPILPGWRQLYGASPEFRPPDAAPHAGMPTLPLIPAPGTRLLAAQARAGQAPMFSRQELIKKHSPKDLRQKKEKKQPPKEHPNQCRAREQLQPCPSLPLGDGEGCGWQPWVAWVPQESPRVAVPGAPRGDPAGCPFPLHLPASAAAAGSWCGVLGAGSGVLGGKRGTEAATGGRRRRREGGGSRVRAGCG